MIRRKLLKLKKGREDKMREAVSRKEKLRRESRRREGERKKKPYKQQREKGNQQTRKMGKLAKLRCVTEVVKHLIRKLQNLH